MNPKIKLCWSDREFNNFYSEKYAIIVESDGISYVFFRECIVERVPGKIIEIPITIKTEEFGDIKCTIKLNEEYEQYNHDNILLLSDNAFRHQFESIDFSKDEVNNLKSLITDEVLVEIKSYDPSNGFLEYTNVVENILIPNTPKNVILIELNF